MNIAEVLSAAANNVAGASAFEWACFGPNAHYLQLGQEDSVVGTCVFDREAGIVYALELFDVNTARAWMWVDPLWVDSYLQDCDNRGIDPTMAWDRVRYTPIDNPQLMLVGLGELMGTILNDPT